MTAIHSFLSLTKDRSILIQLWVPGRVFLGKEPEWTPDVRFFRQDEYLRVNHAQMYDVRGSIALPVFEKESGNCLGVVEIVTTTQKITYRNEVESVCKALEGGNEPHSVELSELLRILRTVCDKHELPLGQAWAPCTEASKCRHWNSEKNKKCVSIVDVACYVREQRVSGFHQACSEQQLLRGQGVVGKAFDTNEPRYAIDVTAYSKAEYPLSHHAKLFGLRGAVAIHLQSLYSESCKGYVLEFFLPIGCQDPGLTFHCKIMESLAITVHGSRIFGFFSSNKVEQETKFSGKELLFSSDWKTRREDDLPRLGSSISGKSSHKETSWISELAEAQRKGKEVAISFGKEATDEIKTETQGGEMFADCVNINQGFSTSLVEGLTGTSSESTMFNSGGTSSQSTSSSQTSSSSHSLSTGAKASPITLNACGSGDTSTSQDPMRSFMRFIKLPPDWEVHLVAGLNPDSKSLIDEKTLFAWKGILQFLRTAIRLMSLVLKYVTLLLFSL